MVQIAKYLCVLILYASPLWAANHYVLGSASGSGTGADWTNAYTGFGSGAGQANTASLTRGDTYYVGTGTYSLATIQTVASGTSVITIKGATAADHGTGTGWNNSFGVDVTQAHFTTTGTFSPIGIFPWYSYMVLDGNTGTPAGGPTSYGFTVDVPASCASGNSSIEIGPGASTINNITISHFYLIACGGDVQTQGITLQSTTTANNFTYSYNYFDGFQVAVLDKGQTGLTIDHNYSVNGFSSSNHHGNQFDFLDAEVNPVISNNTILQCNGTVCIGANDTGGTCSQGLTGGKIYGNIFKVGAGSVGDGIIGSTSRCFMANTSVYQNVFTESTSGWLQGCVTAQATCSSATGNIAENNIIYSSTCALGSGISTNDYNSYLSCTDTAPTETHGQVVTLNPFTNAGSNVFTLTTDGVASCVSTSATCTGVTLGSPYNTDPNGNTRGLDGTWERGVFEFNGGPQTPSFSPNGGTFTTNPSVTITCGGGATCCYRIDSGAPTAATPGTCDSNGGTEFTYSTPITIPSTLTLKAIGTEVGFTNSSVASALFTMIPLIAPGTLAFGNQTVNTTSAGQVITFTNNTGVTITFTSVALTTGTQFAISANTCTGTLTNTSSCTTTITFTPTTAGAKSDTLTYTDSDASSPQTVSLSGTGVAGGGGNAGTMTRGTVLTQGAAIVQH